MCSNQKALTLHNHLFLLKIRCIHQVIPLFTYFQHGCLLPVQQHHILPYVVSASTAHPLHLLQPSSVCKAVEAMIKTQIFAFFKT